MLEQAHRGERGNLAIVRELPVASTRLPAHPASSRAARAFIAEHLQRWGLDPAVDDATLLVSELVTSAILHVRTPIEVVVRKVRGAVRVEVFEDGQRPGPDFEVSMGRGLSLVQAVASRWGVEDGGASQTVWFEISL